MPRIEPNLIPLVTDLERGLRELGVPFAIVGALVPELLLDARPTRMTNDADVVVTVESLADFEVLKERLAGYGFTRTPVPHRMRHQDGGLMDILPFSEALAPDGRLELEEGRVMNMVGFAKVVPHAVPTVIDGGTTVPLAPLPLYALLKLVKMMIADTASNTRAVLTSLGRQIQGRAVLDEIGDLAPPRVRKAARALEVAHPGPWAVRLESPSTESQRLGCDLQWRREQRQRVRPEVLGDRPTIGRSA
jgi:hypothetical protein